jgi:hypothetical protein
MPYRDNCFIPLDETLEVAKLRGSYIVMDSNRCKWIRSGKVTRTFASRIQEHRKASKLRNESSKFYQSYPSKECDADLLNELSYTRYGHFEDLEFYCGVAFSSAPTVAATLTKASVFKWSNYVSNCIQKTSWARNTDEYKRVELIAYGLELSYDLCLASADNLSQNPGFETPLGVFGAK